MQISSNDILTSGLHAASIAAKNILLKTDRPLLDENNSFNILEALNTKYAMSILGAMVLGAIEEYHEQLREKLLESKIDIGELDTKSTPLYDSLVKFYSPDDFD